MESVDLWMLNVERKKEEDLKRQNRNKRERKKDKCSDKRERDLKR